MTDTSTYPGTLDGDISAALGTITPTEASDFLHLLADAMEKVQAELGTNPSAASATVTARLLVMSDAIDALEAADAAQAVLEAVPETANRLVVAEDAGKVIEVTNASARTVTLQAEADEPDMVDGMVGEVARLGAGSVTFVAGAGVTIQAADDLLAIGAQYGSASWRYRGGNVYIVAGNLA